jgi:hypothetical protein
MKTKSKMLVAVSIIAALCIGFFIGVSYNSGKINTSDVSGTIGKGKPKVCSSSMASSAACPTCHN